MAPHALNLGLTVRNLLDETMRAARTLDSLRRAQAGGLDISLAEDGVCQWLAACGNEIIDLAGVCDWLAAGKVRPVAMVEAARRLRMLVPAIQNAILPLTVPIGHAGLAQPPIVAAVNHAELIWAIGKTIAVFVATGMGAWFFAEKIMPSAADKAVRAAGAAEQIEAMYQNAVAKCATDPDPDECKQRAKQVRDKAMEAALAPSDCGWLETPTVTILGAGVGLSLGFGFIWWIWKRIGSGP